MLKTSKLIVALSVLGLICWMILMPGRASMADQSGGLVRAHDDSHGAKHRVIRYPDLDVEV